MKKFIIDCFISSPYKRSVDTIKPAADYFEMPIETDERFRERSVGTHGRMSESSIFIDGSGDFGESFLKMKELLSLLLTFARIGAFSFGGGYAMISLIEHTCVEKKKWITHEEMMEITVIAESTPGPIAINLATYVGYKKRKLLGSIVATLGMVLPSFIIIFVISLFLDHFLEIAWIAGAFKGIKIAVGILIVDAAVKMLSKGKWRAWQIVILIVSLLGMLIISALSLHISSLVLMALAALVGLLVFFVNKKMKKEAD